jgi:glucose-1-phosphate cytidylyltransferase
MAKTKKPKVVILAGGMGMRMREETEYRPKPMVLVGSHPILWHIMKSYMYYGFNDFIICLGYKGEMIKEYFLNYEAFNSDLTITFGKKCSTLIHKKNTFDNFTVTLADTGQETMTGGRVLEVEKFIDSDDFMLTYGDGVSNIDIKKLYEFHKAHKKTGTVTGVHPDSRFGELYIKEDTVENFSEKQQIKDGFINGGFFIFKKSFFKYLKKHGDCFLEQEPMRDLTRDKGLKVLKHEGFWQCMDTVKDAKYLNDLWEKGNAPWKVWK